MDEKLSLNKEAKRTLALSSLGGALEFYDFVRRTCKIIVPADTAVAPLKKEAFF